MGAMKRSLLFSFILSIVMMGSAQAAVTLEESTDAEYMINGGFSQAVAEDAFMMKNRALGRPVEPLYERSQNKFVRGWKKFFAYLDPGQDEPDRLHHDIKLQPSFSDL